MGDVTAGVYVFDLDDTLYSELTYQQSGYEHVIDVLSDLHGVERQILMDAVYNNNNGDVLARLAELVGCCGIKESLLWLYRLHTPAIKISVEIAELLQLLRDRGAVVCILSDGRSISQRLKLRSLGLSWVDCYISEEHNSEKPDLLRFELIEKKYRSSCYFYIGDNPAKDFFAPNRLGWNSVQLKPCWSTISNLEVNVSEAFRPKYVVDSIESLRHLFLNFHNCK